MPIRGYRIPQKKKIKVTYYDGSTQLGIKRYTKGKDVLHPSITMPSKTGYTFVGWSTNNSISGWIDTLVTEKEPIVLYAIYEPNTRTISNPGQDDYTSGTFYKQIQSNGERVSSTEYFNIDFRRYQSCSAAFWSEKYTIDMDGYGHNTGGAFRVDGVDYSGSPSISLSSGSHSIYLFSLADWIYEKYDRETVQVTSITLSNPIAWT